MRRRAFLKTGLLAGASLAARLDAQMPAGETLLLSAGNLGRSVPETFTGLSYELAELTRPETFSPANTELIAFFKRLSPHGVLRIGGNSSEFCWFRATPSTPAIQLRVPPGDLGSNWMPHHVFAIDPVAVDHLAGFLRATGWHAIYGLNFGNSTPERAAIEAAYVHRKLGDSLRYFQIGNEPDFYRDSNNGVRPPGWGFADYVREWTAYADAVTAQVPEARFGGPDTGASSDWVLRFGEQVAPRLGKRLVALSGHYYAEGPPDAPTTTTARLLAGDPKVLSSTTDIVKVADAHGLVYRMTEGNSCYRGGKPGMSNAFAASLWAADYLLELASLGCAGVNLHGGKSQFVAASLGDHNPGLKVAGTGAAKRTNGFYTTISDEDGEPVEAMPIFYGVLFAQVFAGRTMLRTGELPTPLCRLYAATGKDGLCIGLINKGTDPCTLNLRLNGTGARAFRAMRLTGSALDATSGVTLGGSPVAARTAAWTPQGEPVPVNDGVVTLSLAGPGAILLQQSDHAA